MRREHMIRVRASDDELEQLVANAEAMGLSLSAFLRLRGLHDREPQVPRHSSSHNTTKKTKRRS